MAKAVPAYAAVGISPPVRGVLKREQSKTNIDHLYEVCAAACWLSSLALPVKLIVIPEGAPQGFTDEVFDWDHDPKNLWLHHKPMQHAEYNTKVIQPQVRLMQERGIFTPPAPDKQPWVKTPHRTANAQPKRCAHASQECRPDGNGRRSEYNHPSMTKRGRVSCL